MKTILHLLRSEPDEMVVSMVETLSGTEGATVTALYSEALYPAELCRFDWKRLVDDIFSHDTVICWW
jgi:hypothetical protein